ncbi:MAG: ROK family protein [Cyclobacteriaceae bacterium]|nr:ROK family protein [Cyclobacteriaceae bacterium HetDA_MAG_MS6]
MIKLGIDVGGSGIKGALVDTETGQLTGGKVHIDTPSPAAPDRVCEAVVELVTHFRWQGPVGCGFPTIMADGRAKSYGNIDERWLGVRVDALFEEHTGVPFTVVNDADAAGCAEMTFGSGRGKNGKVLMVTIGTGLGTALYYDGQLIPNIELGRINSMKGEPIEFYASSKVKKEENLSIEDWAHRFDYFLNHVDRVFSPDHFIIGGGISENFEEFCEYLTGDVPITVAQMRNSAGIVGAALAAGSLQR